MAKMLTVQEASEFVRLPVSTLNRWRQTGEGPSFGKLGRRVFYREDQLTAWVDEEVYAAVAAAAPDLSGAGPTLVRRPPAARIRLEDRPIVRSVHVTEPAAGVAEVVARVQTGARSKAIALRLEQWRGRWRCNALTVG